jgi:hypothetical protein
MASNRCPACPSTVQPTFLVLVSQDAVVDYYRCPRCGHVWSTEKGKETFSKHVTPLRKTPESTADSTET